MDFDDFFGFAPIAKGRAQKYFAIAGLLLGAIVCGGISYLMSPDSLQWIIAGIVGGFFGALLAVLFAAYIIAFLVAAVVFGIGVYFTGS